MKKTVLILGLITSACLAMPAGASEQSSRLSYMTQTCHHSTSAKIKGLMKKDGQDTDVFCGCVSKAAIKLNTQPLDHTFALAYHEANIIIQQSLLKRQTNEEMAEKFETRAKGYSRDFDISYASLAAQIVPAQDIVVSCFKDGASPKIKKLFPTP